MNPRSRTLAVVVGAVVLAAAAGVGVAATGDSSAGGSTPSMNRPGPGGPGGFDLTGLADELGVSESRLQAALDAARPSRDAGGDPGSARSEMAEALAEELGLSVDKVEAALEATMPSSGPGAPPGGADAAVDGGAATPSSGAGGTSLP
jgi:hypothetical protein